MKIGTTIKEIRKKKGISQKEFAKSIDKTPTYISLIESDKKKPSLKFVQEVADYFGVPSYYILFKSMEEEDVVEEKRDAYKKLAPSITSMIEGFFINE